MKIARIMKGTSRSVAIISLLGASATGLTQMAYAFSSGGYLGADPKLCAFSIQLQKSVPVRKQYLTRIAALTGEGVASGSAVEEMYSNVKKASYSAGGTTAAGEAPEENFWDFSAITKVAAVGLDEFSADCLGCHDGVSAGAVTADLRNNPFVKGITLKSFKSDHPIGMDYNRYVDAGRGRYKAVTSIDPKMIFVDGKVGCLTCHDPLNPDQGHLVMSDRNSALCRTCHDK